MNGLPPKNQLFQNASIQEQNMKKLLFITILFFINACTPAPTPPPTETPVPTVTFTPVSTTSASTTTAQQIYPTGTPIPTQPVIPPMITPDAIQVERWEEYQDALAITLFPSKYTPQSPHEFLCEWEILGKTKQDVYIWAVCMSIFPEGDTNATYQGGMLSIVHIGEGESIQSIEQPRGGNNYASDIHRMFPLDVQEKYFSKTISFQALTDHLEWRRTHPKELPLVILSATSTP